MIEFKVIENLKPDKDLTLYLKKFKYKVKLGQKNYFEHQLTNIIYI